MLAAVAHFHCHGDTLTGNHFLKKADVVEGVIFLSGRGGGGLRNT